MGIAWPLPAFLDGSDQLGGEACYPPLDFVPYRSNFFDRSAGGILERPVLVALAGMDRAGIPASHRHHDIGLTHVRVMKQLRLLVSEVDADLRHGLDRDRVDRAGRLAPGRQDLDAVAGEAPEETRGHLAATSVVNTNEQDGGLAGHFPGIAR